MRCFRSWRVILKEAGSAFQLCGFGPIAAAARASGLISRYKPQRVLLIGIAGSFDTDRYAVGTACRFDQVVCSGVGVGIGTHHRSAEQIGWQQFSGGDAQPQIGDRIALDSSFVSGVPFAGELLTCCSASADPQETALRRQLFPDAVAEDMEGFAVAMACSLARVPLQIVRGIPILWVIVIYSNGESMKPWRRPRRWPSG